MNDLYLPETFDKHRVPDDQLAEGYERTSPEHRAWLKTTLALAQSVYGESPTALTKHCVNTQTGFGHAVQTGPAPWAVVALNASFNAAPRLASALMVARLANLNNLVVVRLIDTSAQPSNTPDISPALIAALELTGVDHVLNLTLDATTALCTALHRTHGLGRLLLFGANALSPLHAAFDRLLHIEGLPLWLDHAPKLGISPKAVVDKDLLHWAHPDSTLTMLEAETKACLCVDALLCATPDEPLAATAPLRLLCNHETNLAGAWLSPSLPPAFFQDSVLTTFMLQNNN